MKNLVLARPIVFFDLETTGLEIATARIIEISLLKIYPDGKEELLDHLVNPEIPIPEEATQINGIQDIDVMDKPGFRQLAASVADFMLDCDLSGFNIKRFDLPILEAEFRRAGVGFSRKNRHIIDSQHIYHKMEPRDLQSAYRRYCGRSLENCHRAVVDVKAAVEILDSQIEAHPELPKDTAGLHAFCFRTGEENWLDSNGKLVIADGEVLLNFGKYNKKQLKIVVREDPDYLKWLIHQPNFPVEVYEIVVRFMSGDFELPENC